jgi:SAM-dependent MidA family methyltransferase
MAGSESQLLDPEMNAALVARLSPDNRALPLPDFIDCALYHPQLGYYRRPHKRVGHSDEADFYTAGSLGPVFAELVIAAAAALADKPLNALTLVEFGPESPAGLLDGLAENPFKSTHQVRPGEPLEIPSDAVVFSNELFDAQPFRRLVRRGGQWREAAVRIEGSALAWTEIEPAEPLPALPGDSPEGYTIDWPSGAHALLETICWQHWNGLFIAFDYGLDRETAFRGRPQGTGRTYSRHRMGDDLLAAPGHIDITCHLVWEEMVSILAANGFRSIALQRQESFFMHHAAAAIATIAGAEGPGLSRRKQTLMELLHPGNMGHKFQVLHARR